MRVVVKVGGSLLGDLPRLRDLLAGLADGAEGPCVIVPGGGPDADAVREAQIREGFSDAEAHRRALDAMGRTAERFRAIEGRLVVCQAPWAAEPLTGEGTGSPSPRLRKTEPSRASSLPLLRGRVAPARGSGEGSDGAGSSTGSPGTPAFFGRGVPLSRPLLTQGPPSPAEGGRKGGQPVSALRNDFRRRGDATAARRTPGTPTALVWNSFLLRAGHPDIPETWDVTSDSLALWLATRMNAPACIFVKSADAPAGSTPEDLARSGLCDAAFPAFARCYRGTIAIRGPAGPVPVLTRRAA